MTSRKEGTWTWKRKNSKFHPARPVIYRTFLEQKKYDHVFAIRQNFFRNDVYMCKTESRRRKIVRILPRRRVGPGYGLGVSAVGRASILETKDYKSRKMPRGQDRKEEEEEEKHLKLENKTREKLSQKNNYVQSS